MSGLLLKHVALDNLAEQSNLVEQELMHMCILLLIRNIRFINNKDKAKYDKELNTFIFYF